MKNIREITRLVFEGEFFKIEFYVRENGVPMAQEWLDALSNSEQAKFAAMFAWLANQGKIANEQKFKHLTGSDKIFEFKVGDGRILSFFYFGKRVILTHGFFKKSPKTPKGEIERAETLKKEFESRI